MKCLFLIVFLLTAVASCKGTGSDSSDSSSVTAFTVTSANAPTSYTINGTANPTLTLQIGKTYTFNVNVPGDPFYIMTTQGTNIANAYSTGVTGNGSASGAITFTVSSSAPSTLFYDSSAHSGMTGTINITQPSGNGGGW